MNLWLDVKYANLVGNRLQLFKVKRQNPYVATFRCHICGDSKKSRFKTRGYFYVFKQRVMFICKNCGASHTLSTVLNQIDPQLLNEYKLESVAAWGNRKAIDEPEPLVIAKPKFLYDENIKALKTISQLSPDHPAKKYVVKRCIPAHMHYKLLYAPKFKKWVNSIEPGKFDEENLKYDEPRLIIPFVNPAGKIYGFQGRAFHDKTIRYISIMLDTEMPKIFGWEKVDLKRQVFVFEGPIDSMFVDNSLAMAGADFGNAAAIIGLNPATTTVVYDNEPRNKEIVNRMEASIVNGYNVCIWPNTIEAKDINAMVLKYGYDSVHLRMLIDANTYSGLRAKITLGMWRKV